MAESRRCILLTAVRDELQREQLAACLASETGLTRDRVDVALDHLPLVVVADLSHVKARQVVSSLERRGGQADIVTRDKAGQYPMLGDVGHRRLDPPEHPEEEPDLVSGRDTGFEDGSQNSRGEDDKGDVPITELNTGGTLWDDDRPRVRGDRYKQYEKLGGGGMGVVYRAYDRNTDRDVAIKEMRPKRRDHETVSGLQTGGGAIEKATERFLEEARMAAQLKDPNIVQIYDSGWDDLGPYYTMELLDGGTLEQKVKEGGGLPVEEVADIGKRLCWALDYAHTPEQVQRGGKKQRRDKIIHRDVKPRNVLLSRRGEPKLADFGIARAMTEADFVVEGGWAGERGFMAPEQEIDATRADERSDIYGLGATLYYCVTGRTPQPADENALPLAVRDVVLKALAENPRDRHQTAREFLEALEHVGMHEEHPEGSCPKCGHGNPPYAESCENCRESLVMPCFECGQQVRHGAKYCTSAECKADLRAAREQRWEKIRRNRSGADALAREGDYDGALRLLREVLNERHPEFEDQVKWAEARMLEVDAAKEEDAQERRRVFAAVEAALENHQYEEAIAVLDTCPPRLLDEAMTQMSSQAQESLAALDRLKSGIKHAIDAKDYRRALGSLLSLQDLQPERNDIARAIGQLRGKILRRELRQAQKDEEAGDLQSALQRLEQVLHDGLSVGAGAAAREIETRIARLRPPVQFDALRREAEKRQSEGHLKGAASRWRQIADIDPTNSEAREWLHVFEKHCEIEEAWHKARARETEALSEPLSDRGRRNTFEDAEKRWQLRSLWISVRGLIEELEAVLPARDETWHQIVSDYGAQLRSHYAAHVDAARERVDRGDYAVASLRAHLAQAIDPSRPEVQHLLDTLEGKQAVERRRRNVRLVVKIGAVAVITLAGWLGLWGYMKPKLARYSLLQAKVYASDGDFKRAIGACAKVLRLSPSGSVAKKARRLKEWLVRESTWEAEKLRNEGRVHEALQYLQAAVEKAVGSEDHRQGEIVSQTAAERTYVRAESLLQRWRLEYESQAMQIVEQARKLRAEDELHLALTMYAKIEEYPDSGTHAKALSEMKRLKRDYEDKARQGLKLARKMVTEELHTVALSTYRDLLRKYPDSAVCKEARSEYCALRER